MCKPPVPRELNRCRMTSATGLIRRWTRFRVQEINLSILTAALEIKAAHGFSYWDSAIIAAARALGCQQLYTEDMSHGRQVEGLLIITRSADAARRLIPRKAIMGEFALGQAVPRFRGSAALARVGPLRRRHGAAAHGIRPRAALASCACQDWRHRCKPGAGGTGGAGGADRRRLAGIRWGDLPVRPACAAGMVGRCTGRAFRRWSPTGCAGSATTSRSFVAETKHQAADAAELIEVDYEPLPAIVSTADATEPGAAPRLGGLPRQHLLCPRGRRQGGSRGGIRARRPCRQTPPRHQPGHRGGDGTAAARSATTIHLTAATRSTRRCSAPTLTAPNWPRSLTCRESRVRVVAGDIGGSFGMKSAILQRGRAGAARLPTARASGQMDQPARKPFSPTRRPRHVTEAELALDRDGTFLAFRVKTIAAVGAYAQAGSNAFVMNLGTLAGVYRTPAIHADVTAVFSNTKPDAALSRHNAGRNLGFVIERMVDEAAAELGTTDRAGAGATRSARGDAVQNRADLYLRFAASSRKTSIWRSILPASPDSKRAAPKRTPRKLRGIASPTRSSAPPPAVMGGRSPFSTAAAR